MCRKSVRHIKHCKKRAEINAMKNRKNLRLTALSIHTSTVFVRDLSDVEPEEGSLSDTITKRHIALLIVIIATKATDPSITQ